jgi:hypothetical protein
MAFFTGRSELGKSPQTRLRTQESEQEQVRKLVRDDFTTRQRPADNDLAGYAVPPLQQAIAISLREIDGLIVEFRRRREELLGETARMQNEIIEYARLNQSTIDSTKVITERLANFNKAADADSIREPTVENSNQEGSQTGSSGLAEDVSAKSCPDTQTKRTEDIIPTEGFATGSYPAFPSEASPQTDEACILPVP